MELHEAKDLLDDFTDKEIRLSRRERKFAERARKIKAFVKRQNRVADQADTLLQHVGVRAMGINRDRDTIYEYAASEFIPIGELDPDNPDGNTHGFAQIYINTIMRPKPKHVIRRFKRTCLFIPEKTEDMLGFGISMFTGTPDCNNLAEFYSIGIPAVYESNQQVAINETDDGTSQYDRNLILTEWYSGVIDNEYRYRVQLATNALATIESIVT